MDPRPPHQAGGSLKQAAPSCAQGDAVLEAPAPAIESHPDEITAAGSLAAISQPDVVHSQALNDEVTAVEDASAAVGNGHQEDEAAAEVAGAAAEIQMVVAVNDSFVPINDVKAMMQTGRLEGQRIAYQNKRHKMNLLNGVIRGMAYFCSCIDCDKKDKALSVRAFELHALKNGKETHNPNDHIILCSSNISLFDACRRLKEATNEATLQATFDIITKSDREAVPKQNLEAHVISTSANDCNLTDIVRNLEKRMESTEKRMENLQSQVDTIEKNIDFFCKEMVRYQELFQDLSKIIGKFVDDM